MAILLKPKIKYFRFSDAASQPPGFWIYCWGQNPVPINSQSELSNTNYMRTISRRTSLIYLPAFVISQQMAAALQHNLFIRDVFTCNVI